ncbi:MAG TPA: hypothetical protein VJ904_10300 [Tichowtungia sp.]|nr:hypothetical protein [Tichowtungia sp.]
MFRVKYSDGRTKIRDGYGFYAAHAIGHDEGAVLVDVKEVRPGIFEVYEATATTVAALANPTVGRLIATAEQL